MKKLFMCKSRKHHLKKKVPKSFMTSNVIGLPYTSSLFLFKLKKKLLFIHKQITFKSCIEKYKKRFKLTQASTHPSTFNFTTLEESVFLNLPEKTVSHFSEEISK